MKKNNNTILNELENSKLDLQKIKKDYSTLYS